MSEAAARDTFRKHVLEKFPDVHYQRFEDRFHSGIPDINLQIPAYGEWWIEAKFLDKLPGNGHLVRLDLRREQVMWLRNRKKAGGHCLVLVRIGTTHWVAFNDHYEQLEKGLVSQTFFQTCYYNSSALDVRLVFATSLQTQAARY